MHQKRVMGYPGMHAACNTVLYACMSAGKLMCCTTTLLTPPAEPLDHAGLAHPSIANHQHLDLTLQGKCT